MGRALAGAQKKAEAEGRTLVWVDETGVYRLPALVRTWAPRGQTPILRAPLSHDHLSLIGAITEDGRVLCRMQATSLRGLAVGRFLRHLLHHIPGQLLVLWDGAPIHRAAPVKAFLQTEAGQRLHLERLPAYAPDLNPADGLWHLLKRGELKSLVCDALWELRIEIRLALARLRHRRDAIRGCIAHAGYSL